MHDLGRRTRPRFLVFFFFFLSFFLYFFSDEHIFFSYEHLFSGIAVAVVVVVFFVLFLDLNRVLETRFLGGCHVEKVPHQM